MIFYYSLTVAVLLAATVFEILKLNCRKSLNFSVLSFFEVPAGRDLMEFCYEPRRTKSGIVGLFDGDEITTVAVFVWIQYQHVTDRWTEKSMYTLPCLRPALA